MNAESSHQIIIQIFLFSSLFRQITSFMSNLFYDPRWSHFCRKLPERFFGKIQSFVWVVIFFQLLNRSKI